MQNALWSASCGCAQTQHGNDATFTPQSFLFPNETEDLRNTADKIAKKKKRGIYNKITLSFFFPLRLLSLL